MRPAIQSAAQEPREISERVVRSEEAFNRIKIAHERKEKRGDKERIIVSPCVKLPDERLNRRVSPVLSIRKVRKHLAQVLRFRHFFCSGLGEQQLRGLDGVNPRLFVNRQAIVERNRDQQEQALYLLPR